MPPGGRGRGRGPGNWCPPGGEMTFSIPAHKCGLVIGRGGENVKAINQQTGAFVEISRQPPPNGDPNFKLFIIRGSPQQIDHAKQLIEDKIEVPQTPLLCFILMCSLVLSGLNLLEGSPVPCWTWTGWAGPRWTHGPLQPEPIPARTPWWTTTVSTTLMANRPQGNSWFGFPGFVCTC